MTVSSILRKLQTCARKRPLLVNSVVYGSFYTGAEFTQQTYNKVLKKVPQKSPEPRKIEEPNITEAQTQSSLRPTTFNELYILSDGNSETQSPDYNWAQLRRYAIYGCLIAGPVLHGWYKWLDTFFKGKTTKIVLVKLIADQFILTPPLLVLFFSSMSIMENKSDIFGECKAKFVQTFKTSCLYWLPVQFLNFLLIPPSLRVFFVSVAAFCWANILCYLKSVPLSN